MVKYLPDLSIFTVFLKNRTFISKIRRSKVTDYAALNNHPSFPDTITLWEGLNGLLWSALPKYLHNFSLLITSAQGRSSEL